MPVPDTASDLAPGLTYVSDALPGLRRQRRGKGFRYVDPRGRTVSAAERARILALGIPPAWEDVWICRDPGGHIQATGLDAAGRKQYRYHPGWSDWRARSKYDGLAGFGAGLARFRARVARDLAGTPGDLAFALAAIAVLLDRLHLRVGSACYATRNRSFGATTLLNRHLQLAPGEIRLRFRAKGGQRVEHRLRDSRLHRIFEAIDDLPGRNLFTWIDEEGCPRPIGSDQVNAYVAAATGVAGATAKTFRTWSGSLAALEAAEAARGPLRVRALAEAAAARLVNTPAVSRSAYIHPRILGLAELDPDARAELLGQIRPAGPGRLRAGERRLIGLLSAADPAGVRTA